MIKNYIFCYWEGAGNVAPFLIIFMLCFNWLHCVTINFRWRCGSDTVYTGEIPPRNSSIFLIIIEKKNKKILYCLCFKRFNDSQKITRSRFFLCRIKYPSRRFFYCKYVSMNKVQKKFKNQTKLSFMGFVYLSSIHNCRWKYVIF